jgi:hypothetical protein
MSRVLSLALVGTVFLLTGSGCGGSDPRPETDASEPASAEDVAPRASVSILEPSQGAEVSGDALTVRMEAVGVEIVPAGALVPGTGHHHLYLDEDLGEAGVPVPTVPGRVIHLGTGVSEYTFEGVAPGPHRLIAVVADGLHVPLDPWVVDTVTFTVR